MKKLKKQIPFDFVLTELESLSPYTKAMFGAYAVYVEDQIIFITRNKPTYESDNGVWLATDAEHHKSLKKIFPNMRSIKIFGPGPSSWQILPADAIDFEESVLKACQLVLRRDPRIGKVPKNRLKKKKKKS